MKKNTLRIFFIIFLGLLCLKCFSQQSDYAILYKNVNIRANSLIHELNKTKDSLILQSEDVIDYVYTINRDSNREIDEYINRKTHKIALTKLSAGRHTFIVGNCSKQIIFAVKIFCDPSRDPEIDDKLTADKSNN